eukprot:augustus_masked-scaffold_25-processed-gene-2.11-mRNA-1 protein AED:0.42 eAED:0.42 QI:0/-1/0/1/-1/1/1/0/475
MNKTSGITKDDIRFLNLHQAKFNFSKKPQKRKSRRRRDTGLIFTIETTDLEKLNFKVQSEQQLEMWRTALEGEANKPSFDLSEFLVLDSFGKGSFGEVNIVLHGASQQIFAIKRVSMGGRRQQLGLNERVILEQVNVIRDKHKVPSLLKLYVAFNHGDDLIMMTEAYHGGNVYELAKKLEGNKIPEESVRYILASIVQGLKYLHMYGIAHRDLKPENMMLTKEGKVILIDFGLSLQLKKRANYKEARAPVVTKVFDVEDTEPAFEGNHVYRKSYQVVGTSFYQAPEMLKGDGHDLSVDWWQVGCIAYEFVMGQPLFQAQSSEEVSKLIENSLSKRLSTLEGNSSAEFFDLVQLLVVKEPTDRLGYSGAEEVMNHPFFEGFDWDALQNETLEPPQLLKPAPELLKNYNNIETFTEATTLQGFINNLSSSEVQKKQKKKKKGFLGKLWSTPKYDIKELNTLGLFYIYQPFLFGQTSV